jgi:hypothetical protein
MICGLDISTSCVGICFLNDDGSLYKIEYLKFKDEKTFHEKVDAFKYHLFTFCEYNNLFYEGKLRFLVEAPLLMCNKSMAATISLLQRFNACCCYVLHNSFGVEAEMVSAAHARKLAGIQLVKGQNTKEIVFEHVKKMNLVPEATWEYKKTGKPKESNFDMADALVIALSGVRQNETKGTL